MNVFETVKANVTVKEAAERYGFTVNRSGMIRCPFHHDRTPSMKVDNRFHCFGCGADGDVIDFAARLFQLNTREAAEKLKEDFGLPGGDDRIIACRKQPSFDRREAERYCFRTLSAYFRLLKQWEKDYEPHSPEDSWHPRYIEALQQKNYVEYLLDMFTFGSTEERVNWIRQHEKEVKTLELRLSKPEAGRAA